MQKILAIHHRKDPLAGLVERLKNLFPDSLVVPAFSWETGLKEAQQRQPDVIVMGDTDLVEAKKRNQLCRQLKSSARTQHIPLIMCNFSGNGDLKQTPECLDSDFDILLARPVEDVDDNELQSHINTMLRLKDVETRLHIQNEILEETVRQRTRELKNELDERKRVQEELRKSEEKYRQLINASNDGIYLLYNRKFEMVNEKFLEMFAVTRDTIDHPDFDFLDMVAPKSRQYIKERYDKINRGEPVDLHYEFTALTGDGRELEVESSVSFIKYKKGFATQGVVRDVTRRKASESQKRQSQKIEALSTLAGGIAHDFNNILAIIRGYTELAVEDLTRDSQLQRNLQHVLNAADRAKELVNQILTFSRQGEGFKEYVRISEIVREVVDKIGPSMPAYTRLRSTIDKNTGVVMGDPSQLRQVIINLCVNALHAMQETGGVLEVSLEKIEIDAGGIDGFKNATPGPYVKLTVKDTGHGMGEAVAERIFDPYFTTKSTGEGSGMGLAVIYGIVKDYGGDIMVHTEPGTGTTFYLFLPCVQREQGSALIPEQDRNATLPCGNERILLVEDETVLLHIQEEILEPLGYHVLGIPNSMEALELFRTDSELFDLVIANETMPYMSGSRLAGELIKIRADIPIILCTGFGSSLTRDAAVKAGVKGFIMKPIIKREIAGTIRDVLKKKGKEREINDVTLKKEEK
jgi:PAS domain S-box-containing protein